MVAWCHHSNSSVSTVWEFSSKRLPRAKVPSTSGHITSCILLSSAEPGLQQITEHLKGLSTGAGVEDACCPPGDITVLPQ